MFRNDSLRRLRKRAHLVITATARSIQYLRPAEAQLLLVLWGVTWYRTAEGPAVQGPLLAAFHQHFQEERTSRTTVPLRPPQRWNQPRAHR